LVSGSDGSGHTVTTPNNPDPSFSNTDSAIDLTFTNNKLSSIDKTLSDIKSEIKDLSDFKPADSSKADTALDDFKTATTTFDLNWNNYKNFVDGIKLNFTTITTQFEATKSILENKPTINQITGQCGFDVVLYNKPIHVDPCMFVSPYRSLLSIIFTLFGTFAVLIFAVKYLIARSD